MSRNMFWKSFNMTNQPWNKSSGFTDPCSWTPLADRNIDERYLSITGCPLWHTVKCQEHDKWLTWNMSSPTYRSKHMKSRKVSSYILVSSAKRSNHTTKYYSCQLTVFFDRDYWHGNGWPGTLHRKDVLSFRHQNNSKGHIPHE